MVYISTNPHFKSVLSWCSGLLSGNIWRNLSSLMPQREVSAQVCLSLNIWLCTCLAWQPWLYSNTDCKFLSCIHTDILLTKLYSSIYGHLIVLCDTSQSAEDSRFPGAGRTLGSSQGQMASGIQSNSNLQARLLEDSSPNQPSEGRYER